MTAATTNASDDPTDTTVALLSVGLPGYNGERYLEESIRSIVARSFTDFELIICDNVSTDRNWGDRPAVRRGGSACPLFPPPRAHRARARSRRGRVQLRGGADRRARRRDPLSQPQRSLDLTQRHLVAYLTSFQHRCEDTDAITELDASGSSRDQRGHAETDGQARMSDPLVIVGGLLAFSARQPHPSVPNESGRTRFSIDFRTVHVGDILPGRVALVIAVTDVVEARRSRRRVTAGDGVTP